jgi:2,4-dienoyl-CoA reductase-like NADH-dependent reductase (Old Yellow Enzyme family)
MAGIEGMEPVFDDDVRQSTREREAYFASYAKSVQGRATMPLLVTGGFRTVAAMNDALDAGEADMIGLGRPLCADADVPNKLLSGEIAAAPAWEKTLRLGPTLERV